MASSQSPEHTGQKHNSTTRQRGFALPLVLVVSAILAVAIAILINEVYSGTKVTNRMLERRSAFLAADGMMRVATVEANRFLRANPLADSVDLQNHFSAGSLLDDITPSGYTRDSWDISTTGVFAGPIPNGPFQGMQAQQFPIDMKVRLKTDGFEGESIASVASAVTLAQISAFQFFIFVDGWADWYPWPTSRIKGRAHANGDFCIGGKDTNAAQQGIFFERITSAGGIYHLDGEPAKCRHQHSPANRSAYVATSTCAPGAFPGCCAVPGNCSQLLPNADNGCVNCDGTGMDWKDYATSVWNGKLQDGAHGVPSLKLPITSNAKVQAGANVRIAAEGLAAAHESNLDGSRFLVDPVVPGEPADSRAQKFMYKAHIRIINGVWYLRNSASPEIPGTPIWSDHPGSFAFDPSAAQFGLVGGSQNVGQADIAAARGWLAVPQMFSYYETNVASNAHLEAFDATPEGVISYGTLYRDASVWGAAADTKVMWRPGFRALWDPGDALDDTYWCGWNMGVSGDRLDDDEVHIWDATATHCGGTASGAVNHSSGLLEATRSGIKDVHMEKEGDAAWSFSEARMRARTLPINFDIAAFQAALANTSQGELGCYFSGGACAPNLGDFNGIVYITHTWPGWDDGFDTVADGAAGLLGDGAAPKHGALVDAQQWDPEPNGPGSEDNLGHERLPWPLCGQGGAIGDALDPVVGTSSSRFYVPACNATAYPNALRIINGAHFNATAAKTPPAPHPVIPANTLPVGLTVVTNLPLYVQGDYNTTSEFANGPVPVAAHTWTPSLLGGDITTMLSNKWDDKNLRWDIPIGDSGSVMAAAEPAALKDAADDLHDSRTVVPTTYSTALLTGWVVARNNVGGIGLQNVLRNMEVWSNQDQTFNGSIIVSHYSVFARSKCSGGDTFSAPKRPWSFDEHFNAMSNQPPGAPEYNVHAVRSWSRR